MKKYIIYIGLIAIGLLVGKFMFSNSASTERQGQETIVEHWTCSMHPEIDLLEFGACPKCGMDLIPAATGEEGLEVNQFKMTKNAMALANVQTFVVGTVGESQEEVSGSLRLSGKIQENSKTSAMQTAHFGGRIERLYFKMEGEVVKRGALIATVYSPELVTAQNELLEAIKIKELQPELYKAVRNKLKNWKISENQVQQIERTQKVITNFNMYANVSGVITKILAQEGNHVKEGTPLFMISNLNSVWAVFDVYEQDITNLKKGQHLVIQSNAYPNEKIESKIDFIDPVLNSKTRTITVRATLNNKNKKLKPGMLLYSFVIVKDAKNTESTTIVEVPKTAVLWTGKRSVVYVKPDKENSVFELREVELGQSLNDMYQIVSGLENGEEIVVNGTFTVDAVAQLQGKMSMMNNKETEKQKKDVSGGIEKIEVAPKFKKQLSAVVDAYFKLKDAFVATNVEQVIKKANQVLKKVSLVQMSELKKPEAHTVWMSASKSIKENLKNISKEKNIEKQRHYFITVSNEVLKLSSIFGTSKTVYVQFCPMANDNSGAQWLSAEEKIMNPYFGDKMLHCGSVEEVINNNKNTASSYKCPMDCEHGKTYNKPGSCPVCKMDLKLLHSD